MRNSDDKIVWPSDNRIDSIAQNGNSGDHYESVTKPTHYQQTRMKEEPRLEGGVGPNIWHGLKHDAVLNPRHYALIPEKGVQVIDVIRATLSQEEFKGYCKGNIIKYTLRAGQKFNEPSNKDLAKAKMYINYHAEEYVMMDEKKL